MKGVIRYDQLAEFEDRPEVVETIDIPISIQLLVRQLSGLAHDINKSPGSYSQLEVHMAYMVLQIEAGLNLNELFMEDSFEKR